MEKLGIFGGTFSPPHNGHMAAARAFLSALSLDRVLFMPTFVPPHKTTADAVPAATRLALLRLACAEDPRFVVSDFEINKGDISYTYQTLEAFTAPERELYFLCGTDMFLSLPIWKEASRIFALATIVCMRREDDEELARQIADARMLYEKEYRAKIVLLDAPHIEISSSKIRELLAAGDVHAADFLPPAVLQEIQALGLYTKPRVIDTFVRAQLDGYRLAHTYAVKEECARLANLFSLSFRDRARLETAALLHDVTKGYTTEEHVALLATYGETPTTAELAAPKTLHARTAALLVANRLKNHTDAGICHAIAVHTTGGTDMSLFDWLLYLADYIEPTRTFTDCVTLRRFFYDGMHSGEDRIQHLYKTILYSFELTLAGLAAEGATAHPTTAAVYERLRAHPEEFLCACAPSDCSPSSSD